LRKGRKRVGEFGRMGQDIGAVHLKEIDDVRSETLQRVFAGADDSLTAGVVWHARDDAELRCQHHARPQPAGLGQHLAQQGFGLAEGLPTPVEAIDGRNIDQRHSGVQRGFDALRGRPDVGAHKTPQPVGQRAHLQA
jgi:hypothetical protein